MKILVLSDIHANLTALDAVLQDAGNVDEVWILGDIVGYGPDPNECISRIRKLPKYRCLAGNHDAGVLGEIDLEAFNVAARKAVHWTSSILTKSNKQFLSSLKQVEIFDDITLVHGSPRSPIWEYLINLHVVKLNFNILQTKYCVAGHTHIPVVFTLTEGDGVPQFYVPKEGEKIELTTKTILNPGSVGQPRDHDIRAAYALFDSTEKTWTFSRIAYDIPSVQERMRSIGAPQTHISRLAEGW